MSRILSLVALLSASLSLQAVNVPCGAQAEFSTSLPSIKTKGDAQVNVNPDLFSIIVGVATQDKDLSRAYALNEETGSAVLAVAKKHKLKPEDVSTSQLTVTPDYQGSLFKGGGGGVRQLENFYVKRTMSFKFRDSALLEPILKDCVAAGANQIERINYETSELRKHKDAARILALKAARESFWPVSLVSS